MERARKKKKERIMAEVKKQLWLAGPVASVNLLLFSLQLISLMFVGHLGELALSSASMAVSFAMITGFCLLLGMSCALDTFCGQAYGAKQYHMLGVYMQRAMLVLTLVSIPIAFIWAYTGKILMALKQNQEISIEAGSYERWMIPSIFAYGYLQCLTKFLQTQNNVFPMLISSGIAALLHLPLCWILVFKSGLGIKGASIATNVSYWVNVVLLAFYVKFSPTCRSTWVGFSKEAFHDVLKFLRLSLPSALMTCLEFWSFQMMVLFSGFLPNPKLETSVLSISLNTNTASFMIVSGLGSVISIRVSNELGAGFPEAAQLAIKVAMSIAGTVGIISGLSVISIRTVLGKIYSSDEDVVKHVAAMIPLIAVSIIIDGFQCVLSGIVRGCGQQRIGAFVNLGAYYVVGVPTSILCAFVLHARVKGLWLGIISALSVQSFLLLVITLCINWEKEVEEAKIRVYSPTNPKENDEKEIIKS